MLKGKDRVRKEEEGGPLNSKNTAHQAHLTRRGNAMVHFFAITDTTKTTGDANFRNGTVQQVDFRVTHSHCAIVESLQIAQLRKNSPSTRFTEDVIVRLQRTWILQK
jgi:hypothetical protein